MTEICHAVDYKNCFIWCWCGLSVYEVISLSVSLTYLDGTGLFKGSLILDPSFCHESTLAKYIVFALHPLCDLEYLASSWLSFAFCCDLGAVVFYCPSSELTFAIHGMSCMWYWYSSFNRYYSHVPLFPFVCSFPCVILFWCSSHLDIWSILELFPKKDIIKFPDCLKTFEYCHVIIEPTIFNCNF